jgi:RNA polymerase sigma-70 factor (ECF subfamily)
MAPNHPKGMGALQLELTRGPAAEEPAPEQDVLLVRRALEGDATAFHALYEAEFDFVLRTCMRFGLAESDAEDATQETFQIAHRKLARFTQGSFSTWLYRIAANVVSDMHRRRRVRETLFALWMPREVPLAAAPDAAMHEAETVQQVREVLSRMAAKKREVFVLYELEGLSGEEIAERIDCNVATVWTRLHYARQEFKRIALERGLDDRDSGGLKPAPEADERSASTSKREASR